jgi:hypothetical protein
VLLASKKRRLNAGVFYGLIITTARRCVFEKTLTGEITCRPVGRRTGCAPFFDRAMEGESKNPRERFEQRAVALSGKGPFLLVTFLWARAKKSDPAAQRSEALQVRLTQTAPF